MMAVKFILGLLFVLFLVSFAAKNQQEVNIAWYMGHNVEVKLWLGLLASLALGFAIAGLGWTAAALGARGRSWKSSREIASLREEIETLRQKPLPDEPSVYPPVPVGAPALRAPGKETKSLLPKTVAG